MLWFFIATIGPLLNAIANHIDKYSISNYLRGGSVGALVLFSALCNLAAIPLLYIGMLLAHIDALALSLSTGVLLALNDILIVGSMLLYFWALEHDEATHVVPLYQTIPLFGFALGYIILGETIAFYQGVGVLTLLTGALVLSIERRLDRIRFKSFVVACMLGASFLYAVNGVAFKYFALDVGFWPAVFWGCVGKVTIGLCMLLCVPTYRKQLIGLMQKNSRKLLGLNAVSESLYILAETSTNYAFLLAPVGLVLLVNAFQPFFVFALGSMLTYYLPHLGNESLTKKALLQKCTGIGLLILGTVFIGVY